MELLELGAELEAWKHSLPAWLVRQEASSSYPWLEFTVQKLLWRYSNLRVIVFRRPFLERALRLAPLMPQVLSESDITPIGTAELAGVAECLASAQETIHSIHHFFSTHSAAKLEWWYGL
jgi:transcriptional regulatory protein GAL4